MEWILTPSHAELALHAMLGFVVQSKLPPTHSHSHLLTGLDRAQASQPAYSSLG